MVPRGVVVAGLGGRAITQASLERVFLQAMRDELDPLTFLDMDWGLVERQIEVPKMVPVPVEVVREILVEVIRDREVPVVREVYVEVPVEVIREVIKIVEVPKIVEVEKIKEVRRRLRRRASIRGLH